MGALTMDHRAGPGPDHRAIRAADPYAFQVMHARLAWLLRLSVAVNIVQLVLVIGLGSILLHLAPLKEVRVALLRADPADDRIYRVEPLARGVDGFDLAIEFAVRRYVRLLLEIDPVSQRARLREALAMTGAAYAARFRSEWIDSGRLDDAIEGGLNRSIVVESAARVSARDGVFMYAVDLRRIDRRGGRIVEEKPLRAYLNITTRPHEVREAEKFENPLGFRVLDLRLKSKPDRRAAP